MTQPKRIGRPPITADQVPPGTDPRGTDMSLSKTKRYYWRNPEKRRKAASAHAAAMTPEQFAKQKARMREYMKEYRLKNPERYAGYSSPEYRARRDAWRKANPELLALQDRRGNLRKYGLTPETYQALLDAQGGVCAICKRPETTVIKGKLLRLSVDHSHADNRVRGLLCFRCNAWIGNMGDDPALIHAAAEYLERLGL